MNNQPFVVKSHDIHLDSDYRDWIAEIKQRYQSSQIKAAVKVNSEALLFNCNLGATWLSGKQRKSGAKASWNRSASICRRHSPDRRGLVLRICGT